LELYNNDHSGYPASKDGIPTGITPTYLGTWPVAPEKDGTCTDYYNTYWYEPTGTKTKAPNGQEVYSSFTISFCFGGETGGYSPGIGKLTPEGMKTNIDCPTTKEQCFNNPAKAVVEDEIKSAINKIEFSGELSIDATYSDYGKKEEVREPEKLLDLLDVLRSARAKARDAKRLADIRQISSGLELYLNDKNEYPNSLTEIEPGYLTKIPEAPKPPDGQCSEQDNMYTYTRKPAKDYSLSFCLGDDTGGFNSGKRELSPIGIQ
jgi:hypothetical protein